MAHAPKTVAERAHHTNGIVRLVVARPLRVITAVATLVVPHALLARTLAATGLKVERRRSAAAGSYMAGLY